MRRISLNGQWDFVVDLDPKYHKSKTPPYARPDWDHRHWLKVPVPGVWNKYEERLDIYEGVCWFAREFVVDSLPEGAEALLRFGGVNYKCRVFLNNKEVGTHEGGYTEFTVDVSNEIRSGKNYLAIEVDNRATETRLPPCLGYFNYGGIHRDVSLEIYPGPYMKDVFFDTKPGVHGGSVSVTGKVVRFSDNMRIRVRCNGREIFSDLKGANAFDVSLTIPGVTNWRPDSPTLYPTTVQLLDGNEVLHEVSYDVGFRSIEMANSKILLNGEPIFLKGICYLYDSPVYGLTLKPDQFLADIALLKEMGVNAIRSHFPFTREFYEACDRAGIMIWIETPVYCIHPADDAANTVFSDASFQALAEAMLEEMILPARSHPSVVIYGVGNECNVANAEAEGFFQKLCAKARSLDQTRLLSYAALYCIVGPLARMVDILGMNQYWGWYDKIHGGKGLSPEDEALEACSEAALEPIDLQILDDKLKELKQLHKKPMLLTEFGADSIPGYLSKSRDLWSEEYHADLLRETFAIAEKHPEICGTFPFGFSDYRDPSKHVNAYWDHKNYKGVVSYHRRPKKAFYVLKEIYEARS